jgi:hypothetical protein
MDGQTGQPSLNEAVALLTNNVRLALNVQHQTVQQRKAEGVCSQHL